MSEEPTTPDLEERSRQLLEALRRRDWDAVVAMYATGAVLDGTPAGGVVFQGPDAIVDFHKDWRDPYEDYDQEMVEFTDLGNGVSFAVLHQRGRLTGSSGFVEHRMASVVTWSNGLIERITLYTDIDEARAAAERLAEERG